jgi:cysteine desulfurase / selenocysteine lyase
MERQMASIREQFPILKTQVNGKPLVYLDNAASTQKPTRVINAIAQYYNTSHSNVHRGVHSLSQKATQLFEEAREAVRNYLNAESSDQIIFTKGCTDAINTVASGYERLLKKGDEVLISYLEHHSNIVPWQMACERSGASLKIIPMNHKGELEWSASLLSPRTKMVAVNHVSNALGTINPIQQIIADAHAVSAAVLIDGAQATPHFAIDVQALDADFYTFSGHKVYGPTGIGVLYGKRALLEKLPPYQGGGDMIKTVTFSKTTYAPIPFKFEAGTPNMAGAIGLHEALNFMSEIGLEAIASHENRLLLYATEELSRIPGIRFIGTAENKASVLSFLVEGAHPYDVGVLLDQMGIAVRTGHHCTQPIMDYFEIPGTVRASFGIYNTMEEVDQLVRGVMRSASMLV